MVQLGVSLLYCICLMARLLTDETVTPIDEDVILTLRNPNSDFVLNSEVINSHRKRDVKQIPNRSHTPTAKLDLSGVNSQSVCITLSSLPTLYTHMPYCRAARVVSSMAKIWTILHVCSADAHTVVEVRRSSTSTSSILPSRIARILPNE